MGSDGWWWRTKGPREPVLGVPVGDLAQRNLAAIGQCVWPLVQDDGFEGRHEPQAFEVLEFLLGSADAHIGLFGQLDGAKRTATTNLAQQLEAAVAWGNVAVDVHRLDPLHLAGKTKSISSS